MTEVHVVTTDGGTITTGAIDVPVKDMADLIAKTLQSPGGVLTLHARRDVVVIPCRTIRYVRVDAGEEPGESTAVAAASWDDRPVPGCGGQDP